MGRRLNWLQRLAEDLRDAFSNREHAVTQAMLRRYQGYSCQMPEGDTRTLRALAEIAVLAPTGMQIARYRLVVDPPSLKPTGLITAGFVPVHGGVTRLFEMRFIGTLAVVPLKPLHGDFEPMKLDVGLGFVRIERKITSAANTNTPPEPDPRSGTPHLVYSR